MYLFKYKNAHKYYPQILSLQMFIRSNSILNTNAVLFFYFIQKGSRWNLQPSFIFLHSIQQVRTDNCSRLTNEYEWNLKSRNQSNILLQRRYPYDYRWNWYIKIQKHSCHLKFWWQYTCRAIYHDAQSIFVIRIKLIWFIIIRCHFFLVVIHYFRIST